MKRIFYVLLFAFVITNCSGIQAQQVRINDVLYDIPVSITVQLGDTMSVQALGLFERWRGDLAQFGTQNPINFVVNQPLDSVLIDYSTSIFSYFVELLNGEFYDKRTFEFDVYISTPDSFTLTSYQVGLNVNQTIGTNWQFSYIQGSSDLTVVPSALIGINEGKLTFASLPGSQMVSSEMRLGRFRLTGTFTDYFVGLSFLLLQDAALEINTIFTGVNFADITQNGTFLPIATNHKVPLKIN